MKKVTVSVIFFLLFISQIHADRYQLIFRDGANSYNISYSSIKICDGNNVLFEGVTDKYGRIEVNINRAGTFNCIISYRGKEYQRQLPVMNSNEHVVTVTFP
jgi:hypothetical protein